MSLSFIFFLGERIILKGEGPLVGKSASGIGDLTSDSDTTPMIAARFVLESESLTMFIKSSFSGIRERLTEDGIVVKRTGPGIPNYTAIYFIFDNHSFRILTSQTTLRHALLYTPSSMRLYGLFLDCRRR